MGKQKKPTREILARLALGLAHRRGGNGKGVVSLRLKIDPSASLLDQVDDRFPLLLLSI